jgi:hypothetical protein
VPPEEGSAVVEHRLKSVPPEEGSAVVEHRLKVCAT